MGNLAKLWMAWGIWLLAITFAYADDPPARTDYLLLRSGAVLSGHVVKEENTYILSNPGSSGESRYPAAMVAKLCSSPQEVYEVLKKHIIPEEASDHCRLAKVCLQYSLMKEARAEIEAALQCDRRSSEAITLMRQWQAKTTQSKPQPEEVPALPTASVKPIAPVSLDDWPVAVQPVAFQDFSRRIQPMLLAGCGVGACHGNAEGKRGFALKRGLVGVQPSVEMSKSNLERTLALVDAVNPDVSELLKKAQQPHGNVRHWSVTAEQQEAFKHWASYISGKAQETANAATLANGASKTSNDFASGNAPPVPQPNQPVAPANQLPVIPGMSGSAVKQTGAESPAPPAKSQDQPPASEAPAKPGGLPPIPGVSGKGQGGAGQQPAPPPQGKPSQSALNSDGEHKPVSFQDQPAYQNYARRLGLMNSMQSPVGAMPDRMQIVNAGTYNVFLPPQPELPEEVQNQLKRQEEAKKKPAEAPAKTSNFMNTGTIVSGPGK